jgi:uncharacterized SAM-binding protein YcdF (DUF218 family)
MTERVVIIFGAAVRPDGSPSPALRRRVEAALRFGATLYIPTGAKGRYGDAEAMVMARQLQAGGVPSGRILLEPTGTDTLSSVRAVVHLLRQQAWRGPVYVASNAYHQPRCVWLLRLAGVPARAAPPPPEPAASTLARRWYWRLREVPAIPYDLLLMAWLRLRGTV